MNKLRAPDGRELVINFSELMTAVLCGLVFKSLDPRQVNRNSTMWLNETKTYLLLRKGTLL